jgi:hypothetical protein
VPANSKSPTANSGYIVSQTSNYFSAAAAYTPARNGDDSLLVVSASFVGQEGTYDPDAGSYGAFVYQTFVEFDTSGGGTVTGGVALKLWLANDYSTTDFTIEAYVRDFGTSITTADWINSTDVAALTPLAASVSTAGIGTGVATTLTLSGTVLQDAINTGGTTRIVLVSSRNRGGNTPTNAESVQITLANCLLEYTTTSSDPSVAGRTQVGVATRSTVRPEPSVATRTQVGAVARSTVRPEPSVATFAAAGVTVASQPTITVSVAAVAAAGVTVASQPTITVSVATFAAAGALVQSGGVLVEVSTSSRTAVGVVVIAIPGTAVVVTFGPLIVFREPNIDSFDEPGPIRSREPSIDYFNEPHLIRSHEPAIAYYNEPALVRSREPATVASGERGAVQFREPSVITEDEPHTIQANEPRTTQ